MTLEQFKQALQPYLAAKAAFETIVYAAMGYTTKSTRSSGGGGMPKRRRRRPDREQAT